MAFILLCLASCDAMYVVKSDLDLRYTPQEVPTVLGGMGNEGVAVTVADLRQERTNVVGRKMSSRIKAPFIASIESKRDVVVVIKESLELELQHRGYLIENDANAIVEVELNKYWIDWNMGFSCCLALWAPMWVDAVAELDLNVAVKKKSGNVGFTKRIHGKGLEPMCFVTSGKNAQLALEQALADGIRSLFQDPTFTDAIREAMK